MADEPPKIFIDEDWKAQVAREKEAARKAAAEAKAAPAAPVPSRISPFPQPGAAPQAAALDGEGGEIDPRDEDPWRVLVSGIITQVMLALGVIAPRGAQEVMVDLDYAVYNLRMLEVLREKTKGNLTADEEGELTQAFAELQQMYAMRAQQVQEQALRQAGITNIHDLKNPPRS